MGNVTWADAHLTETGVGQALAVNAFWKQGLVEAKIPAPQRYYTSPLHRCLATAHYTFTGLELPSAQPFIPEIKEVHLSPPLHYSPTMQTANLVLAPARNKRRTHLRPPKQPYLHPL